MTDKNRYLLVKDQPFLDACRDWQDRHVTAIRVTSAFVNAHGGDGYYRDLNGKLAGISASSPPKGWRASGRGKYRKFVPRKDAEGIISAMRALPEAPSRGELNDLVGCPLQVRWADGAGWGFEGLGFMQGVNILWPAGGEPFVLVIPDARPVIEDIKRRQPNAVITQGADWGVPVGLEEITEAEWTLIKAQAAVEAERKAA